MTATTKDRAYRGHVKRWRVETTTFGAWLQVRIYEAGLTMTAFAAAMGVTLRAVESWRRGERYPMTLLLARMSDVLCVPVAEIVYAVTDDAKERGLL